MHLKSWEVVGILSKLAAPVFRVEQKAVGTVGSAADAWQSSSATAIN